VPPQFNPPLSSQLLALPDGDAGTRATLEIMARLVRQYRKDLAMRELALSIVRDVSGWKDFFGMAAALCLWVHGHIQYVRDIRDVETVQTPDKTLALGQGDCDDQSTLLATLLEAVGFPTHFVAIKTEVGAQFVHVLCEADIDGNWTPLETTEKWRPGTFPRSFVETMVQEV
jgi:transglutaminase-like putative cysteine protease